MSKILDDKCRPQNCGGSKPERFNPANPASGGRHLEDLF